MRGPVGTGGRESNRRRGIGNSFLPEQQDEKKKRRYFFLGPLFAIGGLGAALVLLPPFLDMSTSFPRAPGEAGPARDQPTWVSRLLRRATGAWRVGRVDGSLAWVV